MVDQKMFIYISSVEKLEAVWSSYQELRTIGTNGERQSMNNILLARLGEDNVR